MNIQTQLIFPKPLWMSEIEIDIDSAQKECYLIKEQLNSINKSNRGVNSFHSPNIKDLSDQPIILKLMKSISKCVNTIHKQNRQGSVFLNNFWININGNGSSNIIHTHSGSSYSGVYYIKIPIQKELAGGITFYRESYERHIMNESYTGVFKEDSTRNPYEHSKLTFKPEEKKLIIFPSYLPHAVEMNNTNDDRISLSFNFSIKKV